MLNQLTLAPPDPILGLSVAFKEDPRPHKINLSVGVFQDEAGRTPILESVKEAERRLLAQQTTKNYMPIDGDPAYDKLVRDLVFEPGGGSFDRVVTAHTPGGTGALRVAADLLAALPVKPTVWVSDPTWANHPSIFKAAGLPVKTYAWFDAASFGLNEQAMLADLARLTRGDVVLLHGCCHNPTGVDPTPAQWERIADVLARTGAVPLVDLAYQGFADGLEADTASVRLLARRCGEVLVCSSFSKNFGLYNERVGALSLVLEDLERAKVALSQLKRVVRSNYSNPPAHGGAIVVAILSDPGLRLQWSREVDAMRERIARMRQRMVEALRQRGVARNFDFLLTQRGMFSYTGLSAPQARALRDDHAVYIVDSGRINVAGLREATIDPVCDALAAVLS